MGVGLGFGKDEGRPSRPGASRSSLRQTPLATATGATTRLAIGSPFVSGNINCIQMELVFSAGPKGNSSHTCHMYPAWKQAECIVHCIDLNSSQFTGLPPPMVNTPTVCLTELVDTILSLSHYIPIKCTYHMILKK